MITESQLETKEIKRLLALKDEELIDELVINRSKSIISEIFGNLPPENIQEQFTGMSYKGTFKQALTFLKLCETEACNLGNAFDRSKNSTVLDFGCGWGRITQLLSLYFKPYFINGCDVMDKAIEIVKDNKVKAFFSKIETWPPTVYTDKSVDYIFSYSVFSHLSEDNSWAWIREFERILKPGGLAFLTTRHRSFLDYLQSLHDASNIPHYAFGAAQAFHDIKTTKAKYDKGEFCFDSKGTGGDGLTPVYGEAFIPSQYVYEKYGKVFKIARFLDPIPDGLLDQATIVLQKK